MTPSESKYNQKLYGATAIDLMAFWTGPLTGFYLLYKNFQALGEPQKAKKVFLTGWIFSIFFFIAIIFASQNDFILPLVFTPIIWIAVVDFLLWHLQKKMILQKLKEGMPQHSVRKMFGVAFLWLMVNIGFFVFIIIMLNGIFKIFETLL